MSLQEQFENIEKTYPQLASNTESSSKLDNDFRLMHSAIGMASELHELINAKSSVNMLEELGDIIWYAAIPLNVYSSCPYHSGFDVLVSRGLFQANTFRIDYLVSDVSVFSDRVKRYCVYRSDKTTKKAVYDAASNVVISCFRFAVCKLGITNYLKARILVQNILRANIAKLAIRYPAKFEIAGHDVRNLEVEASILNQYLDQK